MFSGVGSKLNVGEGGLDLSKILTSRKKDYCYGYIYLCKKVGELSPPPPPMMFINLCFWSS